MDEELESVTTEQIVVVTNYRSVLAWVLMVMFIVVTPFGVGVAVGSFGWGLFACGIVSGITSLILGSD